MSDQDKPKGGFMTKFFLTVFVLLLLGGAGAGGYWWSQRGAVQAAPAIDAEAATAPAAVTEPSETTEASAAGGGLVSLEPFLVNLADPGRYLRASVTLVLTTEERAAGISENEVVVMRLRSAVLELLAEQRADALVTADGKTALKALIRERAGEIADAHIVDVLFADFVVQ